MKQAIKHINKIILVILAIQVLNVGLFAQEFPANSVVTNQQNIINSVTEYIAEVVLQRKDSFPESHHHHNHQHHKNTNSFLFKVQQFNLINVNHINIVSFFSPISEKAKYQNIAILSLPIISFDITPPPPKCSC